MLRDVRLHGAVGQPQPPGDAGVGAALGHQRRAPRVRAVVRLCSGPVRRWRPISRATTSGSSAEPPAATRLQRVEEVVDVEDAVLEQVAEAARRRPVRPSAGSRCAGRAARCRVPGCGSRMLPGGAGAVVGVVRRHPDVDDREVGPLRLDRVEQRRARRRPCATMSCPASASSAASPSRNSAESSPITMRTAAPPRRRVPRARRAVQRQRPAGGGDPVGEPGQPGPCSRSAPPRPSSRIRTVSAAVGVRDVQRRSRSAPACLTALVTASLATKYAVVATSSGSVVGPARRARPGSARRWPG